MDREPITNLYDNIERLISRSDAEAERLMGKLPSKVYKDMVHNRLSVPDSLRMADSQVGISDGLRKARNTLLDMFPWLREDSDDTDNLRVDYAGSLTREQYNHLIEHATRNETIGGELLDLRNKQDLVAYCGERIGSLLQVHQALYLQILFPEIFYQTPSLPLLSPLQNLQN